VDCGLAIEQAFDDARSNKNDSNFSKFENFPSSFNEIEMILYDACSRCEIADSIFFQAKKAARKLKSEKGKTRISCDVVAAISLFNTLTEMNIPRTADEICSMFNINERDFWKHFKTTETINTSADLMIDQPCKMGERFAAMLNIPFKDLCPTFKKLKEFIENAYGGYRPQSLAAAAIFSFVKKSKTHNVSLDRISKITGVSGSRIRKLSKQIFQSN
jgi:transcription initiation factor TFIIIB Brf1 subunit/transcription initiation factor TFIIB